jgi:hypothetical protein
MSFTESGRRYRVFHTEGFKKAPVDKNAGQSFVFMTATHDGIQQLVGVAGNAMYLGGERYESERQRFVKILGIKDKWREVWELPGVRRRFKDDVADLRRHFSNDVDWVPNWICPADFFFWLDVPVTLSPQRIIGSDWLPKMFSGYKSLDREAAAVVMNSVPMNQRTDIWVRLLDAMRSSPEEPPAHSGNDSGSEKATTRLTNTLARIGQGIFRDALKRKWDGGCAVTGLTCAEILRASHVKSWSSSNSRERLDPDNGLLLAAHLDALFDKGLISFDDAGKMLLSSRLQSEERVYFGLPLPLRRTPDTALRAYLAHHRDKQFSRKKN